MPTANYMNKSLFVFIFIIFLTSACKKELYQSSEAEKKRLKIEEFNFDSFQAKTKIKYDDGIQNFNATANIRIRRDSAIWISLSNTGVEMIRAIIQKDSIFVIDRLNKSFREFSFDSLKNAYNIDFNYTMVQSVLIGNLILERKNQDKVVKDNGFFILKQNNNDLVIDSYVNSKTMKIEKVNIVEKPSSSNLKINYEDFQLSDNKLFPFKNSVFLSYNKNKSEFSSQINIDFSRVAVDEKKIKFPFNIPNRYAPQE